MRKAYYIILVIAVFCALIKCTPSEPVDYAHQKAGFKITAPGGWAKMSEDSEMYEFRQGDYKLIEVGGFDLEVSEEEFSELSRSEFQEMMVESTLDGLDGYCEEAEIMDWSISDEKEITWGGQPAYRVTASGFSEAADKSMTVDLITTYHARKGRMFAYMFASQIANDVYNDTKTALEATIASFQIID